MAGIYTYPLVTEEEYKLNFAHSSEYCKSGGNWPNTTILLYKYSTNGNTEYDIIPKNTWTKVENIPTKPGKPGKHAETIMIEELERIQGFLKEQSDYHKGSYKGIHSIEVILSYSPCSKCSDKLCALKQYLVEEVTLRKTVNVIVSPTPEEDLAILLGSMNTADSGVNFFITFSTFYKHYKSENEKGLIELLKNKIKLYTFTDDKWQYFFGAAGLSSEIQSKEEHLVTKRQKREIDDGMILKYLEIIHYLQEREIKLANYNNIEDKKN